MADNGRRKDRPIKTLLAQISQLAEHEGSFTDTIGTAAMVESHFGSDTSGSPSTSTEHTAAVLEHTPRRRQLKNDGSERTEIHEFSVGDPEDLKESG